MPSPSPPPRPFISVYFSCCKVYQRIYVNKDHSAYTGWCPRCAQKITVRVDPNGTDCRFFTYT